MRRLLAAAAVTATALAAPAQALAYDRTCGGVLDYECNGTVCSLDCFPRECLLWVDPLHNPHSAVCVQPILPSS